MTTHCRLGIAVITTLLLLFAGLATAYADGEGVISGKAQNKTPGGGSVAGLEVTLTTIAHQAQGGATTTNTDADGNFRFEKLVTANNVAYGLGLKYQGVTYSSDLIIFQSGETNKTSDIAVYETVDKPEAVVIERAHLILGVIPETQTLSVMEIIIVNNQGNRVFIPGGPDRGTLQITLPTGAKNLQLAPELADGAVDAPGGFAFTRPVMPGQNDLLYSYELPYKSSRYDLSRSFAYPAQQVSVLIPDKGSKVASDQLAPQPPRNVNGQNYLNLQGGDLPAGAVVSLRVEGLPMPSPFSALPDILRWAVPVVVGLGFVVIIAFVLLRRRASSEAGEAPAEDELVGQDDFADEDEFDDEEASEDAAHTVGPHHHEKP